MLEAALDDALATVRLVSGFDFPDIEQPYEYLALRPERGYPIEQGTVVTSAGTTFPVAEFPEHIEERHVRHSNALHARLDGSTAPYVVGPLARYTLNSDRLSAVSPRRRARGRSRGHLPQPLPVDRRARRRARRGRVARRCGSSTAGRTAPSPRRGAGPARDWGTAHPRRRAVCSSTGTSSTPTGLITDAQIVPPTSQNLAAIEADLRSMVRGLDRPRRPRPPHRCEQAIRNYDPCISCATHFLDLTVERT